VNISSVGQDVATVINSTRLAQETKPRRFLAQTPFANDFHGNRTTQVNVEAL